MKCEDNLASLIIGYSRPERLKNQLELLSKVGISKIYIVIDGQKRENPVLKMDFENIITNFSNRNSVKISCWFRTKNLGTAVSIITALDWFYSKEKKGIVLEDDVLPSIDFFQFMSGALDSIECDESVWLVSGNQFFESNIDSPQNTWANYPLIWGWGTHEHKWQDMRKAILSDPLIFKKKIPQNVRNFWRTGFSRARECRIDSWAILLAAQMRSRDKFCLLPAVNLVTNIGMDAVASHTTHPNWTINKATEKNPSRKGMKYSVLMMMLITPMISCNT